MQNICPGTKRDLEQSATGELILSTVLYATDFSSACDNAWPWALAFANNYQSKLLLVHVIVPTIYASVPAELLAEAREKARREAQARLRQLQRYAGNSDEKRQVLLREGDVADVLLSVINEYRVDLLVTATRGRHHLQRLLLGSTAEKLFRRAPCPVLVVPERARFGADGGDWLRRIVCPIDFSPGSPAVVAYAASLARVHGAQLIAAHVVPEAMLTGAQDSAQVSRPARDRLRQLLPEDCALPFPAQFEVKFGRPDRAISRIAAEYQADLVVMAVHPAKEVVAHQAERTAYRVTRWSLCPVLTIPQPAAVREQS